MTAPLAIGDWFFEQASSGTMLVAIPVALVAGAVSFFSPCVVPLLPGYVSYATGLSGALGDWLFEYRRPITVSLGVVTIVVGLAFMGLLDRVLPFLQRDVRLHKVPAVGLAAAPLLGMLFAIGWTPCLGPTLTAVQGLAYTEGTAGRGALLSIAYSIGLGIPFLLLGLAYRRTLGAVRWIQRHQVWVTRIGGIMLVAVGVLLVTGWWDLWVADLRSWVGGFEVAV